MLVLDLDPGEVVALNLAVEHVLNAIVAQVIGIFDDLRLRNNRILVV